MLYYSNFGTKVVESITKHQRVKLQLHTPVCKAWKLSISAWLFCLCWEPELTHIVVFPWASSSPSSNPVCLRFNAAFCCFSASSLGWRSRGRVPPAGPTLCWPMTSPSCPAEDTSPHKSLHFLHFLLFFFKSWTCWFVCRCPKGHKLRVELHLCYDC